MRGLIAVTGASGFVGRAVCAQLSAAGYTVRALVRTTPVADAAESVELGDFTAVDDFMPALAGADGLVHLAAVTHAADTGDPRTRGRYDALNVDVSARLAKAAGRISMRRVVFVSSIKVNGENSRTTHGPGGRYGPADAPAPEDNYGRSKLAGEQAMAAALAGTATSLTTLRPPLVFGPGNGGNLLALMRWIARGRPLPLAGIRNRRSLLHVDSLASAIVSAFDATRTGDCYTLADWDVSTPELVTAMAQSLGVRPRLLYVPAGALGFAAGLTGRAAQWRRLSGDLLVDSAAIRRDLGWTPASHPQQLMNAVASWYRQRSG